MSNASMAQSLITAGEHSEHKPLVGMAREHARGAQSHSTYAECSEELSATDPTGLLVVRSTHAVLLATSEHPLWHMTDLVRRAHEHTSHGRRASDDCRPKLPR